VPAPRPRLAEKPGNCGSAHVILGSKALPDAYRLDSENPKIARYRSTKNNPSQRQSSL
jgi:hypothetical protein